MSDDLPDIPLFLRIPQAERNAAWKGRRLTKQGSNFGKLVKKDEDPATRQLRREMEKAEARKKAERFARLRELRGQK